METINKILLIEDDRVDILTIMRGLKALGINRSIEVMQNGEEALDYLLSQLNNLPNLILLDLNMPKMNGIEFLKKAKKHEVIKKIPIVVLTTSDEEADKKACFKYGVAGYMIKPIDNDEFVTILSTINKYWTISKTP